MRKRSTTLKGNKSGGSPCQATLRKTARVAELVALQLGATQQQAKRAAAVALLGARGGSGGQLVIMARHLSGGGPAVRSKRTTPRRTGIPATL